MNIQGTRSRWPSVFNSVWIKSHGCKLEQVALGLWQQYAICNIHVSNTYYLHAYIDEWIPVCPKFVILVLDYSTADYINIFMECWAILILVMVINFAYYAGVLSVSFRLLKPDCCDLIQTTHVACIMSSHSRYEVSGYNCLPKAGKKTQL